MISSRLNSIAAFVVAAVILIALTAASGKDRVGRYADDTSYVRDAMAASVAATGMYGIDGVPKSAIQDVWWRWFGGKVSALTGREPSQVFRILSLIFSCALAFVLIKVLTVQYPRHGAAPWMGGLLAVLTQPLIFWSVNGMSCAAAALLVLLALVVHMSASSEGRPLPLISAACLAAATAIQIEFVAVWLALLVHGIIRSFTGGRSVSLAATLLHGINGVLLSLIFLAPMLNWNMRVIEVPWPRSYDSAMALDALAEGSGAAASLPAIIAASIGSAYDMWDAGGFTAGWSVKLFSIIGLVYWIVRSSRGSRDNYLTIAAVLLLTPLFHGLLTPFVGWRGSAALYQGLAPVWVLATVAGIAALQHALDPLLAKVIPAFSGHVRHTVVLCLFAVTPVLAGYMDMSSIMSGDTQGAALHDEHMSEAVRVLEEQGADDAALLTDQPGWAVSRWDGPVYDLTAELNPEFLYYLDSTPSQDLPDLVEQVGRDAEGRVAMIVLNRVFWRPGESSVCDDLNRGDDDLPFVCVR